MAEVLIQESTLGSIADAIRGKTGKSEKMLPSAMPGEIAGIATGCTLQSKTVSPSESQQTVTADDGYDGLSQVTVGAVSSTYVGSDVAKKEAATYTPGTSDQTIAAGQYLDGAQTIKGDENLIAENIRSGVSVFGVAGTMSEAQEVAVQSKGVTPSSSAQTITPDEGYDYLSQVVVGAIPYVESENTSGGTTVTIG